MSAAIAVGKDERLVAEEEEDEEADSFIACFIARPRSRCRGRDVMRKTENEQKRAIPQAEQHRKETERLQHKGLCIHLKEIVSNDTEEAEEERKIDENRKNEPREWPSIAPQNSDRFAEDWERFKSFCKRRGKNQKEA
jgi:hypothetical protein